MQITRKKQDKFSWPKEDCERVNHQEMVALRWCLAAINSVAYAKDDLAKRLECIPAGRRRWAMLLGSFRSLMDELLATVPTKQCLSIRNVMDDMELRMVPKFTPKSNRVSMDVADLSYIVNHAKKDICSACILNGDECRQCELYQILESIAPRKDWGSSTICPYMKDDWMDG